MIPALKRNNENLKPTRLMNYYILKMLVEYRMMPINIKTASSTVQLELRK